MSACEKKLAFPSFCLFFWCRHFHSGKHCGKLRSGIYILCPSGLKHGLLEWKRQKGLCDRPGRAAAAGPLRPVGVIFKGRL